MQLLDTTHTHQSNLAVYCRTGQLSAIPGIIHENIKHYRRLVYNGVDDMLQNAYPLTYELLTNKEWKNTVSDFLANHPCQSPQVWYMPKEFYQYLSKKETDFHLLKKYHFLKELLWFEWIELEMFMMEDKIVKVDETGTILKSKLILNPEHELLSFNYPVHKKNPKLITLSDKGNYYLIAHRNTKGEILFTDSSPALIRMLEYLIETPLSMDDLFNRFQQEFDLSLNEENRKSIIHFFENAYDKQLIIGFHN